LHSESILGIAGAGNVGTALSPGPSSSLGSSTWGSSYPPGGRFGLKIVTAFGAHVIGAPLAHFLLDFLHAGDVLGTMDVRLFDRDQCPQLGPAPVRLGDICSQGGGEI